MCAAVFSENQAAPTAAAKEAAEDSEPPTRGQGEFELEFDRDDVAFALWHLRCISKIMRFDDGDEDLRELEGYLLDLAIDILRGVVE